LLLLFAGFAMADEAVLAHDIAPPHPRYTQLTQMSADVARRTQGMLALAINPGGKVLFPRPASLDPVRSGKVPPTVANSAVLQSTARALGVHTLPFTITDELMAKPGMAEGVLALVRGYTEPKGLKALAIMRGADTIMIFRNRQLRGPDDL